MQWLFSKRVLLGLSLAAVLVVFLYHAGDVRRRSSIELALTVFGGGAALYGLLLDVFTMRTVCAARFIERWNDPQLCGMRETMRRLASASGLPEGGARSDLDSARAEVANFFEELAILVLHKGADKHLLKDFFRSPEARQATAHSVRAFREVVRNRIVVERTLPPAIVEQ